MSSALTYVLRPFERHRARYESEPVAQSNRDDEPQPAVVDLGSDDTLPVETEHIDEENQAEEQEEEPHAEEGIHFQTNSLRNTMTLAELEEERELARRRSNACVLLAVFVLFRLWIEALQTQDFGLLMLCLVGTSWTARWVQYNREREEELDRRIANYLENSGSPDQVDRNDLRMLSFQAQLALAIMESQRQIMEGGYGHPDGAQHEHQGVSEDAKARWKRFEYKHSASMDKAMSQAGYGSVTQNDKKQEEEGPHCSICLGEYEEGEALTALPCNHIYHDECISSWTNNHNKCPLCNLDLESNIIESDAAEHIV